MAIEPDRDCAHYRGDRRGFDEMHLVGPDFGHGFLKPVEAEYNSETDTTTIRFEHLRRQLWPPEAAIIAMQHIQKGQVLQLAEAMAGKRKAINDICWGGRSGPVKETAKAGDTEGNGGVVDQDRKDDRGRTSHRFRRNRKPR
jgi:hypothetical protein